MKNIKEFFKGKAAGFYIVIVDMILAIVLGIVFFATYGDAMANNAAGNLPEVIGACILLGAVLDILTLMFPEYRFVHLFSIAAYCVSMMKEVYLIPNLIADRANGVAYQGGNLEMNIFYLTMQLIIIISAIVASFIGIVNEDEEERINTKLKEEGRFSKKNIIKLSSGAGVGVVALVVTVSTLAGINAGSAGNVAPVAPVLDDIQTAWQDKVIEYDFDPTSVIYQEDTHPYREATAEQIINNVSSSPDRFLHHKVYEFEGKYTEAYQGNFNYTYSYIYLWEDGLYNGTASGTNIYGYWYNRDSDGNSCLVLKDTANNDMICTATRGDRYYDWFGDLKSNVNGGRTFKMNGFMYTPTIGIFIEENDDTLNYDFRAKFDKSKWTVKTIRNDLRYSAILNPDELEWELPNTNIPGEQEVKVKWTKYEHETSMKITVGDDLGTYAFDFTAPEVKKTYRYIDAFDPTGIICTRTEGEKVEDIPMSDVPYRFDYENNKVLFEMTNKVTYEMPVTFDLTPESNTINATIDGAPVTIVVTSPTTATVSDGTSTTEVSITLTGTGGLAKVSIGEKTSGDDTLYEALPKEFGLDEKEGVVSMLLESYMRSSDKANSYNQTTDTFFIFKQDDQGNDIVSVVWQFNYNGDLDQYMECSYTLNGTTINLVSLVGRDSNNQWQWSSKTLRNLRECAKDDLPFYPY